MNREKNRILSFGQLNVKFKVATRRLAQQGFFYIGTGYWIACYFCSYSMEAKSVLDSIPRMHLKSSPNCIMVTKCASNNIPLKNEILYKTILDRNNRMTGQLWTTRGHLF